MDLQYLDLYHNSLLDDEAVGAVISLGLGQLKELNVGWTSISGPNLLRVLESANTSNLKNLTIRIL